MYFEGMDNAQKTSPGHLDFNSYFQNLHFFIIQTDGLMEKLSGLEELFSAVFKKFLQPNHALRV